jgi:hypothetical protein
MMHNVTTLALVAVAVIMGQVNVGAECITIGGPTEPPKPIQVSGAFCGRLFDPLGSVTNVELDLIDGAQVIVAKARVNSRGDFRFSPVRIGEYRAHIPGFTATEAIEFTSSDQRKCVTPLFVKLVIAGECAKPGHISRVPPRQ